MRAGSAGYVAKQQLGEAVLAAIRRVLAGRIYMSEALGMELASQFVGGDRKPKSPLATLSDRELQVFRLIGEGRRTREIAPILNLSPKTIKSYREHLKQKLDIDGAPELVRRAVRLSKPAKSTDRIGVRVVNEAWTPEVAPKGPRQGL